MISVLYIPVAFFAIVLYFASQPETNEQAKLRKYEMKLVMANASYHLLIILAAAWPAFKSGDGEHLLGLLSFELPKFSAPFLLGSLAFSFVVRRDIFKQG